MQGLATVPGVIDLGTTARRDGWTNRRRCRFLALLVEGRQVAAACRAVGLSVASAYALRGRAGGEAFARAWRAARAFARNRCSGIVTSRAIDGVSVTRVGADGVAVTHHRLDNRAALAQLRRLDRMAEAPQSILPRQGGGGAEGVGGGGRRRTIQDIPDLPLRQAEACHLPLAGEEWGKPVTSLNFFNFGDGRGYENSLSPVGCAGVFVFVRGRTLARTGWG
ncbi:hypothetical protein FHS31_002610 [Sphingomonas vulcanisoli]|uniref:Helix-turn-helix domain-containing protein n=1 Tax=Sphingomonas vulcanisoli TaxID=1658060 RepID=A0ABX0TZ06_9SPHN|nr:hypothetical protein [Sphingomonas vulcanisoli]NIJ08980.1 hypothetical protein [Sphingomonas vulcanisoli]